MVADDGYEFERDLAAERMVPGVGFTHTLSVLLRVVMEKGAFFERA